MWVDFRCGETFTGPEDPKFIEFSLHWYYDEHDRRRDYLSKSRDGSDVNVRDLWTALGETSKAEEDLCHILTEIWTTTPEEDLHFRVLYTIAAIFACHISDEETDMEFQPQLDNKKLIEAVKEFLAKDFARYCSRIIGKNAYVIVHQNIYFFCFELL